MYSERHTIEMVDSYNCLRLDNKDVFQVGVYKENDKQKYFKLDNGKILFENLKVGQLAKIIRSQEEFKVSKLWKVDVDKSKINPGSTDDDIKELGGELMEDEFDFIDYFPEDYKPTRKKIHIVAVVATTTTAGLSQQGVTQAKRSYDVMLVDRTEIICEALIQPFSSIPSQAGDLMSLISTPLTRKLPVSLYEEIKFPQLAEFIKTKDDECASNLSKHISHLLTDIFEKQNLNGTSEDMLHWGIDNIIRITLQIFQESLGGEMLPIEMDRNSKDQGTTTIGNKRPDFLCWTKDVLLFKGEEKAGIGDFSKARDELEEKFNKFDPMYFGNIQFMICYAAAGTKLRFFAIDGSPNTNPLRRLVALSNPLDMKNRRDRVSILCIVVNIARIMRTVSNTIPEMIVPLGKRLKTEKSIITILDDSVEKRVPVEHLPFTGNLNDRVNFLSEMYNHAKGHPGLVQVKEGPKVSRQKIYRVLLETRGLDCQLRNEDEARAMSLCVLAGLKRLHEGGYVHRDIRLPNILSIPDGTYVLIDFEHATTGGLVASERLKDWDDDTLTKHNKYTTQSDLYQFGKMLGSLNIVNSEAGKKFLDDLGHKRINIINVLRHEWFR